MKFKSSGFTPVLLLVIVLFFAGIVIIGLLISYKPMAKVGLNAYPTPSSWKTYSSPSGNTAIDYFSGWEYREFKDGVAFYNPAEKHEVGAEPIVLQESKKSLNDINLPFNEYVKTAAIHEIQNYEALSSIKEITTTSGIVGFETVWKVASMIGSQREGLSDSLPITYFEIPGVNTSTMQLSLEEEKYLSLYEQMAKTFKFSKTLIPTLTPKANLETYTNSQYGFEITYPKEYKALTDKDNLYGWPQAVVLFYNGGQAYDVAVEVWDSEAAYKEKYGTNGVFKITAKQSGDKFITLLNSTEEPENVEIISSFKLTK